MYHSVFTDSQEWQCSTFIKVSYFCYPWTSGLWIQVPLVKYSNTIQCVQFVQTKRYGGEEATVMCRSDIDQRRRYQDLQLCCP